MKINKKITFILILCVLIITSNYFGNAQSKNVTLSMFNLEALNEGEQHTGGQVECHGQGGLYCPLNKKDEYHDVYIYQ